MEIMLPPARAAGRTVGRARTPPATPTAEGPKGIIIAHAQMSFISQLHYFQTLAWRAQTSVSHEEDDPKSLKEELQEETLT